MESLIESEDFIKEAKVVVCIACCAVYNSRQELENHHCSTSASKSSNQLGQIKFHSPSRGSGDCANICMALLDHSYCIPERTKIHSWENNINPDDKEEDQPSQYDQSLENLHQANLNINNKNQDINKKSFDRSHEKSEQANDSISNEHQQGSNKSNVESNERSMRVNDNIELHDEVHNSHQVYNSIAIVNHNELCGSSQKVYIPQHDHQSQATDGHVVHYKLDGTIVVSDEESNEETDGEVYDNDDDIMIDNDDDSKFDMIDDEDYNNICDKVYGDDDKKIDAIENDVVNDADSDLIKHDNDAIHELTINNAATFVTEDSAETDVTENERVNENDDDSNSEFDDSDHEPGLIIDEENDEIDEINNDDTDTNDNTNDESALIDTDNYYETDEDLNDIEDESVIYVSDSESRGTNSDIYKNIGNKGDADTKDKINDDLANLDDVYNDVDGETHDNCDNRFDENNDGYGDNVNDDLNYADSEAEEDDIDDSNEDDGDSSRSNMAMYHCVPCGHVYNNETAYNNHPCKRRKPSKIYTCGMCGKVFRTLNILRVHMKIHIGTKEFVCKVCSKAFLHKHNLVTHKVSHSNDRPFTCETCAARFKRKTHLDRHQLVHSGQKLYSCDKCGFSSARLYAIHRHKINVHTAKRPYICNQCSHSFSEKYKLASHLKNVHGKNKKGKKTQRTMVPCLFCDKKFYWRKHVAVHMQSDHSEEFQTLAINTEPETNPREYRQNSSQQDDADYDPGLSSSVPRPTQDCSDKSKCWFCEKEFSRETGLIRHMKVHHTSDYKKCKKEGNTDIEDLTRVVS